MPAGLVASAEEAPRTRFYVFEQFFLEQGTQPTRIHDFFSKALLPAMERVLVVIEDVILIDFFFGGHQRGASFEARGARCGQSTAGLLATPSLEVAHHRDKVRCTTPQPPVSSLMLPFTTPYPAESPSPRSFRRRPSLRRRGGWRRRRGRGRGWGCDGRPSRGRDGRRRAGSGPWRPA